MIRKEPWVGKIAAEPSDQASELLVELKAAYQDIVQMSAKLYDGALDSRGASETLRVLKGATTALKQARDKLERLTDQDA